MDNKNKQKTNIESPHAVWNITGKWVRYETSLAWTAWFLSEQKARDAWNKGYVNYDPDLKR